MKHILTSIFIICATMAKAQTEGTSAVISTAGADVPQSSLLTPQMSTQPADATVIDAGEAVVSSLDAGMPDISLNTRPTLFSLWRPFTPFGTGGFWDVHSGLNAQISAGVTVGFGKDNPFRGGSFFTNTALMYVQPVSDRVTVALGGELSSFRAWNDNMFSARVDAIVNYKINDRLDASVFGSYSFAPFGASTQSALMPMVTPVQRSFAPFMERCASVGASLTWKCSDNCTLGISYVQDIPQGGPMPMQGKR